MGRPPWIPSTQGTPFIMMNLTGEEDVMWTLGNSSPKAVAGTEHEQESLTFLAHGVVFRGILTVEGQVRVDGRVEGEIHAKGTLMIGDHAVITGNIKAETLITSGKIRGDILASDTVKLLKPGIVIGDIRTPAMSMEAGAQFQGQSDMEATSWGEDRNTSSEQTQNRTVHGGKLQASGY